MEDEHRLREIVRLPAFAELFERFLEQLDRQPFSERKNRLFQWAEESPLTDLTRPSEPRADERCWAWVRALAGAGLLEVAYPRRPKGSALPWERAQLVFPPSAEARIREWLDHPVPVSGSVAWRKAVETYAEELARPDVALNTPLSIPGLEAKAVVERLVEARRLARAKRRTARQLSAALFNGDSKRLDNREDWLRTVLGLTEAELPDRSLLVEAALPSVEIAGYLLIENLDSYLEALDGFWPETEGLALIYVAGFRGTAARVRSATHVRFHFHTGSPAAAAEGFSRLWCDPKATQEPMHFCGDLDFEGLRIFMALAKAFPGLQPWRPGYERMLEVLRRGAGHTAEQAGKAGQRAVDSTGDPWLDSTVLPALRESGRFVDQEVIGGTR